MLPTDAIAREDIRYTMSVYTSAGDRGALHELASAFTPDGVLELLGAVHVGRDAIVGALSTVIDPASRGPNGETLRFLRHNLTSSRIELRADGGADGWTYFNVLTPLGLDHAGVYVDRFVPVGDRWLIAHRRIKIEWRHPHSLVVPAGACPP